MAVEIQEPNDLPPNAITDDNADHFEILVYEQSQDVAGIKRLGIAGWKTYLGFNTHKVNNVANYLGIPNEFPWDSPQDTCPGRRRSPARRPPSPRDCRAWSWSVPQTEVLPP